MAVARAGKLAAVSAIVIRGDRERSVRVDAGLPLKVRALILRSACGFNTIWHSAIIAGGL